MTVEGKDQASQADVVVTPMLSWDFTAIGAVAWHRGGGSCPCDVAYGVQVQVEQAAKSPPILVADRPWEGNSVHCTQVFWDEGRYRMWYEASCPDHLNVLCYAESEDGLNWRKPELGLIEYHGSKRNNICMTSRGSAACVFKDSSAPSEARYRCMLFAAWWEDGSGHELDNQEGLRRLQAKNNARPGEKVLPVEIQGQVIGANSPDGLRWEPLKEPILKEWHDTHNLVMYDEKKKKYIGYFRGFYGGRRAISYSETDNFEQWPPTEIIHHALPEDGPNRSLYSNCYTRYPGRPDIHLLFPAIYHQDTDAVDVQLAVSLNGKTWARHGTEPIVPRGRPGEPDEAYVYADPHLLRFTDGKFRLIHCGGSEYHNADYAREPGAKPPPSHFAWAEWTEDRLAGIHAEGDGGFVIPPQPCGNQLLANYRTDPGGWVRFELIDRFGWPPTQIPSLEGYSFAEVAPLTGDATRGIVTWKGRQDLSPLKGRNVGVRVKLHKATLFAIAMCEAQSPRMLNEMRFPV